MHQAEVLDCRGGPESVVSSAQLVGGQQGAVATIPFLPVWLEEEEEEEIGSIALENDEDLV